MRRILLGLRCFASGEQLQNTFNVNVDEDSVMHVAVITVTEIRKDCNHLQLLHFNEGGQII